MSREGTAFLKPADIMAEFSVYPRRALIITTVVHESRAVKAHLTESKKLIGNKGALYEYGRFSDPAGDWLIVHAITPQGNSHAGVVTEKAFQEFEGFEALMFVGVAGSLKEDIQIGSVVIGDYIYDGHSAKVGDNEMYSRPLALATSRELLTAAQGLIYDGDWWELIRAPVGMELPNRENYPCKFPPEAFIKGIVSGEEVVASDKSQRFAYLNTHFNNCGAVEMEGWGIMSAARQENASAIIVRGISDMCAGKDHVKDDLHQPIAAAHAAAFAFSILSFRSKVPVYEKSLFGNDARESSTMNPTKTKPPEEQNSTRESDLSISGPIQIRDSQAESDISLLEAMPVGLAIEAENAKKVLAIASINLLAWEKTLPDGQWMERPERESIEARFQLDMSSTVLIGDPGSGKSALLSRIASDLIDRGKTVFALKADFISTEVQTESDLQQELQLPAKPSNLILRLAAEQPIYVFIDQLDALASQLDLRSGRLNVLLNLVRSIGNMRNVHILLSVREFEFNHDVRLRMIDAEAIVLALPPWHDVRERLTDIGIDADGWPERARDVVRIPQALKTFISIVGFGYSEPFSTYQAMLEQLWQERIASAPDSIDLISLATDIASQMAEEESLWLAASRFDDRLGPLMRLEALGFIVRSENKLSIAFSHQTIFDYVLARTFVRAAGLLSTYVLERQDSLFIRAKIWSALNYLREAEERSYEREFRIIWEKKNLRRHLRLLLIEFLGQVSQPLAFEKVSMTEVLNSSDLHIFGLKAINSSPGWFEHFALNTIQEAMSGSDSEAGQALRILRLNWTQNYELVLQLINKQWRSNPNRDQYSWNAIEGCTHWTKEVEDLAVTILQRSPIPIVQVEHLATTLVFDQPEVALRLVCAKLDFKLSETKGTPKKQFPEHGTEDDKLFWYLHDMEARQYKALLETMEWSDLPALADAEPVIFLQFLWPWYISVFLEIITHKVSEATIPIYPGQYFLEIESSTLAYGSGSRGKPLIDALQSAIESLAKKNTEEFIKWVEENANLELLIVQQLIANGFRVAAERLASPALDWILHDHRRFQLGTGYGLRSTTIDLILACAPHWSEQEIRHFEREIRNYHPRAPDYLKEPKQRRSFSDLVRATKKDLLQAIGVERLLPQNRDLVTTEQRALGDRFDSSMGRVTGGFIGSPMESAAMTKAKDVDILHIFHEIPDKTEWTHPEHLMRGGNIQLSRAFAEFARADPERAFRLIEQFEPSQQERAAGYALEAMADNVQNDSHIIAAFLNLHARGFQSEEFRVSAARAIEKIADRKTSVSDEVCEILTEWLKLSPASPETEDGGMSIEDSSQVKDELLANGSILWGGSGVTILPSGNFNILSALASIYLSKAEVGRNRYFEILNDHLSREHDPDTWKALLNRLVNAGGSTPGVVSSFCEKLFKRFPKILITREAIIFLAYAQRWDDQFVYNLICDWCQSDLSFLQQAYGELVGLVALAREKDKWVRAKNKIIATGSDHIKIGLAHAAINLWGEEGLQQRASATLVSLLSGADQRLVAVIMDIFRVFDEIRPDAPTIDLLHALADPRTDMTAAPSHFVVEHLQSILPHEAKLVAAIAEKLVAAWRNELGDMRTNMAMASPQLTDLALTLHRLGGVSRQSGISLFETMLEVDAYGARETLTEIDGRFLQNQAVVRRRLTRRRKSSTS